MKKISLFLLTLLAVAQFNINAAFGGGMGGQGETPEERDLRLAIEASMEENYAPAPADDELTPEQLEQIQKEAAEAEQQRLLQEQEEMAAIIRTIEAMKAAGHGETIAQQVARKAAERARKLGDQGAFKGGRGAGPPTAPKPKHLRKKPPVAPRSKLASSGADGDLPEAPPEEWLNSLFGEGDDGTTSSAPSADSGDAPEGVVGELAAKLKKWFTE